MIRRIEFGGESEISSMYSFFLLLCYQVLGDSGPEARRLWKKYSYWEKRLKTMMYSASPSFWLRASHTPAKLPSLVLIPCNEHIHSCTSPFKSPPMINPQCQLPRTTHQARSCQPDHSFHLSPALPALCPTQFSPLDKFLTRSVLTWPTGSFLFPWHFQQSEKTYCICVPLKVT